jgi:hypothetical protein
MVLESSQAKLRRLLELKRAYPAEPFLGAVPQALEYRLSDLARRGGAAYAFNTIRGGPGTTCRQRQVGKVSRTSSWTEEATTQTR